MTNRPLSSCQMATNGLVKSLRTHSSGRWANSRAVCTSYFWRSAVVLGPALSTSTHILYIVASCSLRWCLPGGDNDVVRHGICPFREGTSHLCHGPGRAGTAVGCRPAGCSFCTDGCAPVHPRVAVLLGGAVDE